MKKILISAGFVVALAAVGHSAFAQGKGSAWPKEPKEVFGIPIGGELKDEAIRYCGQPQDPEKGHKVSACAVSKGDDGGDIVLSQLPIDILDNGLIERSGYVVGNLLVTAKHENYRDVKALLIERYGKPSETAQETLQNGYGATFSLEILRWLGRRVSLTLHERVNTADKTAFIFSDMTKVDAAVASEGQKRKADAAKF